MHLLELKISGKILKERQNPDTTTQVCWAKNCSLIHRVVFVCVENFSVMWKLNTLPLGYMKRLLGFSWLEIKCVRWCVILLRRSRFPPVLYMRVLRKSNDFVPFGIELNSRVVVLFRLERTQGNGFPLVRIFGFPSLWPLVWIETLISHNNWSTSRQAVNHECVLAGSKVSVTRCNTTLASDSKSGQGYQVVKQRRSTSSLFLYMP